MESQEAQHKTHFIQKLRQVGLFAGVIVAISVYFFLPARREEGGVGLTHEGRATAAVTTLMGIWWLSEALPIEATALVPIVLFPLLNIASVQATTAPYADKVIFLFMGGLMVGLAMQRWNLHLRFSLLVLRFFGTKPSMLVAGFMAASGFISLWVSNTATVVMMLPIALSVVDLLFKKSGSLSDENLKKNFAICLMLGVAYSASIGGIGTLVGTAPNAMLAAFIDQQYGKTLTFLEWMKTALPFILIFIPVTWLILTKVAFPIRFREIPGARELIEGEWKAIGPMQRAEKIVSIVFGLMCLFWIFRPIIVSKTGLDIDDPLIAIAGALCLFLIPAKKGNFAEKLLTWECAVKLPWGVLLLFGGGLNLASAIKSHGLAEFIGSLLGNAKELNPFLLLLLITTIVLFLTEITSNTATIATLLPILSQLAIVWGIHPYVLLIPSTIAVSCAFMLPAGTPPNALVFASGYVTIPQMCKAGIWLNLIGIVVIVLMFYCFSGVLIGVDFSSPNFQP